MMPKCRLRHCTQRCIALSASLAVNGDPHISPGKLAATPISSLRGHKGAARSSEYAICTTCAMLTGFGEDTSSIMVLVGDANEFR
jgi:hypothetical protein